MWRVSVRKQESYENVSGANVSYMLKNTVKRILCNSLRVEIEIMQSNFLTETSRTPDKLLRHFHSLLLRRFVFRMIEESAKRE